MLEGLANELGRLSQINSNVTVCLKVWLSDGDMQGEKMYIEVATFI